MEPTDSAPNNEKSMDNSRNTPDEKENKFLFVLKKVGFNVWLAVMVIGGALAFITALFLL